MRPSYKYIPDQQKWLPVSITTPPLPIPEKIKIMTLNVLFDEWNGVPYKTHIAQPSVRYEHQFKIMQEHDSDIICLNEITPNYIAKIIQEKWVQNQYFISNINSNPSPHFGNLVLSKFPIQNFNYIELPELKRPIVSFLLEFEHYPLAIAATHLSALKNRFEQRQLQMNALTASLENFYPQADKIILGDVNYHSENEIIPKEYKDIWKTVHPSLSGITFDGTINKMIHELYPLGRFYGLQDDIQMRLDRVFCKMKSWQASEIDICFNTPIYAAKSNPNILKDLISTIFDRFGVNILRNPKNYLFCSDHFGLVMVIKPV